MPDEIRKCIGPPECRYSVHPFEPHSRACWDANPFDKDRDVAMPDEIRPVTPDAADCRAAIPAQRIIDEAIRQSCLSPCRSKRGAVIFFGTGIIASGHNFKPRGFECDGSAMCKATCRTSAIHAEQEAILRGGTHVVGTS